MERVFLRVMIFNFMQSFYKMIYVCDLIYNFELDCTSSSDTQYAQYAQSTQIAVIYETISGLQLQ